MLTLKQIRDWLEFQDADLNNCITVGQIDGNKEKQVGIYPLKPSGDSQRVCIGGPEQTKFNTAWAAVLIHWTKNAVLAEVKANSVYDLFYGLAGISMGTTPVISVDPGPAPIPVGTDVHGYREYVIQLKIYYERI
jgi:hypothetical protein